jgi:hypothetical protein
MEANASSTPYPVGTTRRAGKVLRRIGKALMILGGIWFCWVFALFGLAFFRVVSSHGASPSAVRASVSESESNGDLRLGWEEGKLLLPKEGYGKAVDVPRLEMFAFNMTQGTYAVGTPVRLSDLYLAEYPKQSNGVWYVDGTALLGAAKKYVDLQKTPIVMTSALARRIMEALPDMGESLSPGFTRIYSIDALLGIVQPNPCADCLGVLWSRNRQVLLVKELTIGSRKIVDEGWGQR